jgi:hypothetical protein
LSERCKKIIKQGEKAAPMSDSMITSVFGLQSKSMKKGFFAVTTLPNH